MKLSSSGLKDILTTLKKVGKYANKVTFYKDVFSIVDSKDEDSYGTHLYKAWFDRADDYMYESYNLYEVAMELTNLKGKKDYIEYIHTPDSIYIEINGTQYYLFFRSKDEGRVGEFGSYLLADKWVTLSTNELQAIQSNNLLEFQDGPNNFVRIAKSTMKELIGNRKVDYNIRYAFDNEAHENGIGKLMILTKSGLVEVLHIYNFIIYR